MSYFFIYMGGNNSDLKVEFNGNNKINETNVFLKSKSLGE